VDVSSINSLSYIPSYTSYSISAPNQAPAAIASQSASGLDPIRQEARELCYRLMRIEFELRKTKETYALSDKEIAFISQCKLEINGQSITDYIRDYGNQFGPDELGHLATQLSQRGAPFGVKEIAAQRALQYEYAAFCQNGYLHSKVIDARFMEDNNITVKGMPIRQYLISCGGTLTPDALAHILESLRAFSNSPDSSSESQSDNASLGKSHKILQRDFA
jgi:hypothetical protein